MSKTKTETKNKGIPYIVVAFFALAILNHPEAGSIIAGIILFVIAKTLITNKIK